MKNSLPKLELLSNDSSQLPPSRHEKKFPRQIGLQDIVAAGRLQPTETSFWTITAKHKVKILILITEINISVTLLK